jgi:hypothetical protein
LYASSEQKYDRYRTKLNNKNSASKQVLFTTVDNGRVQSKEKDNIS